MSINSRRTTRRRFLVAASGTDETPTLLVAAARLCMRLLNASLVDSITVACGVARP
ncbi:hypothetical protein [Actinoplanes sp. NPDC051494]|uniref:hypothetical protein n=1 Tax=Actinoplanes sp. NPDC051494 TaxID=3363907 RepID=UPI0037AA5893